MVYKAIFSFEALFITIILSIKIYTEIKDKIKMIITINHPPKPIFLNILINETDSLVNKKFSIIFILN